MPVLVAIKEIGLEGNVEKTKNVFRNCRLECRIKLQYKNS